MSIHIALIAGLIKAVIGVISKIRNRKIAHQEAKEQEKHFQNQIDQLKTELEKQEELNTEEVKQHLTHLEGQLV